MHTFEADIKITRTPELTDRQLWTMREIARFAFMSSIAKERRSTSEIEYAVGMQDENYYQGMIDPNLKVGRGLRPNQRFWQPRVALAMVGQGIVGYSYGAENTSGSNSFERTIKHYNPRNKRNYFWLGSVAVTPELHRSGLGSSLIEKLLSTAKPNQPVTAYLWPQEVGNYQVEKLESIGFLQAGESQVQPFGPESEPTLQLRMQASSVRLALSNLRNSNY